MTQLRGYSRWFVPHDGPVTPEFQAKLAALCPASLTPLDHLSLNAVFRVTCLSTNGYFVKVEADKFRRDKPRA